MARPRRKPARLPRPPYGTYDPSIDASERAAVRGYGDLKSDVNRASVRGATDYGIGIEEIGRQRGYGLADILRSDTRGQEDLQTQREGVERNYGHDLADILSNRKRGTEDYDRQVAGLTRGYERLGHNQSQQANAAGVLHGGAMAQAQRKRAANMAFDRQPLDTNFQRFTADSAQAEGRLGEGHQLALSAILRGETRLGEDTGTNRERLTAQYGSGDSTYSGGNGWADAWLKINPGSQLPGGPRDYGTAGQRLSLDYQRSGEDRGTALRRGGRELNAFQQDLVPTRYYGAAGLNPYAPTRKRKRR